jgi:hypothetical protein
MDDVVVAVSMTGEGEWDARHGGGTTVLRPRDTSRYFNFMNKQLPFDETEVLHTYPFEPNQCVIFVKTFNSWHAVSPLTGAGSPAMRKTLTINIEVV